MNIRVQDPLYYTSRAYDEIVSSVDSYTHQNDADGGFKNCSFTFKSSIEDIEDWLKYGLGRHIIAYSDDTNRIFEGFVNEISANLGTLTINRGPLVDISNRVTVRYTDFTVGQPANTTAQNDTDSQGLYGIWHKVFSVGSVSSATAENIRNTYLQEGKYPETGVTISPGSGSLSITVNCLGYIEFLTYPYNEATDTTYTLREKVLEVLGDSPNAVFSTDYSYIETNTLSVTRLDNDYRQADTVIGDLVDMGGDSNNNRRLFGCYEDRILFLQEIPSTVEYIFRLSDTSGLVRDLANNVIDPWNIRPGKWLQILDLLPGEGTPTNLREDPRMVFIETVTFTAPYDFSINGGKTNTVTQQLAKLGLG